MSVASTTATMIARALPKLERYIDTAIAPPVENLFTEDAMAQRFAERHADNLRYIARKGQWFQWDLARWREEETLLVFELVRLGIREDARQYGNGKPPREIFRAKTFAAVERIARSDRLIAARLDQFDADILTLNTGD
jgi:putative DNA primase/helicase